MARRPGRIAVAFLFAALSFGARPASAADPVEGVWGFTGADGAARCRGTAVLVFRDGRFARVLPEMGTLSGTQIKILGTSSYSVSGDRLEVAPVLTWTAPEPRRTYLIRRGATPELVLNGEVRAVLKPCPSLDASLLLP